jgi:hypothetical protein
VACFAGTARFVFTLPSFPPTVIYQTALPNTLCHIGIQASLNVLVVPRKELLWVVVACIIPDLPWIVLTSLMPLNLFDPYDLRLYCTAQASLLFCLIGSAALALFTASTGRIFAILAANCLFHLLLDSLQIKWGNGVNLLAPFSWTFFHVDLAWPGHPVTAGFTVVGLVCLLGAWKSCVRDSVRLQVTTGAKSLAGIVLCGCYLLSPLVCLEDLERADTYYLRTMRDKENRPGKYIEFDRARYRAEEQTLQTFAGERIRVVGDQPNRSGRVSFRGHFLTPTSIAGISYHYHRDYRDISSLVGLFMACTLLIQSLILPHFQAAKNNQGPP